MRLKKRMVATKKMKRGTMKSANNSIDVKGAADIAGITDILKKNKFVVVLIWANYCGHCHTYKDQVWNKLLANKNRRAGLASIHYDQLENAPAPIPKKVSGYPTVLFVGKNGVPTEYSDSRDLNKMSRIVESEDPEALVNRVNDDTPRLTEEAEANRDHLPSADPNVVLASIDNEDKMTPKTGAFAPNPKGDMLNSQETNRPLNVEKGRMDSGRVVPASGGGSLYKALIDLFKQRQTRSVKQKRTKQTRRTRR